MSQIRVMIVDDHPIIREGLLLILGMEDDFDVLEHVGDSTQVVERVAALSPDVLILDLDMPKMNGVEVVQALRQANHAVAILVFTAFETRDHIMQAMAAGIEGYLLKGAPRRQLCGAIRALAQGGSWFAPAVTTTIMSSSADEKKDYQLSKREMEVLARLVDGLTNKEIGQVLGVTERTAKFHVSAILRKLEVDNRTEAVALAIQSALVE